MREIWMMQPRFERRQSNTAYALIEQARFRAGFDFLRLRADVGETPVELAEWWEDFSLGTDEEREALLAVVREQHRSAPRKAAPRGAKPAATRAGEGTAVTGAQASGALPVAGQGDDSDAEPDEEPGDATGPSAGATTAPRKRRRRRRKPAGGAGSGGSGAAGGDDMAGGGDGLAVGK
jgi:poly(A) polymerase